MYLSLYITEIFIFSIIIIIIESSIRQYTCSFKVVYNRRDTGGVSSDKGDRKVCSDRGERRESKVT